MTRVLEFEVRLDAAEQGKDDAVRLRGELQDLLLDGGALKVDEVDVGQPAPGRRAGELEIIGLLVSFVGTVAAVVQVLQGWTRKKAATEKADITLTLIVEDVTVTVSEVPTPEELNEIRALLERFDGRADDGGD